MDEFRYTLRRLFKQRGASLISVITLASAIGASAALGESI